MLIALLALGASYLIGAIPFGWMIARARGVDIFQAGSGNIGATNIGRVLGAKIGLLVFGLDFAKGAVPVAATALLPAAAHEAFGLPDVLRVGAGVFAFLGHLFPIYLGFRGGKGVATGAGTIVVLMPGPAAIAILGWAAVVASSRAVSLGSVVAVGVLCAARLLSVHEPFGRDSIVLTAFCLGGTALLIGKHRTNIVRLLDGTEKRWEDKPVWNTISRVIHVLALGLWFGGGVMFNFVAAPAIFASFTNVVESAPSDRTAYLPLAPGATDEERKQLASALAGSAVGPIFPRFFALQAACGFISLVTALGWWTRSGRIHRWRVIVVALACSTVAVGWPISEHVSALRVERFHPTSGEAARAAFGAWHVVSLLLSFVTTVLAGIALALAARMPTDPHNTQA